MSDGNHRGKPADETWEIDGISEKAREAAEQAATDSSLTLGIWLTETVLRATQEGVGAETSSQAARKAGSGDKPDRETP